ncbi:hypothetical protein H2198_010986, partial [Neophaeococcomyces mojaviensis]
MQPRSLVATPQAWQEHQRGRQVHQHQPQPAQHTVGGQEVQQVVVGLAEITRDHRRDLALFGKPF